MRRQHEPTALTIESCQNLLDVTRARAHARCVVCGHVNGREPRLHFEVAADGSVQATLQGGEAYEGYAGILHGGVIATLLDAAMTNCLFAHGRRALTAELCVRFRHPVVSGAPLHLRAWLERASAPLFVLRAELRQGGRVQATATGKFMEKVESPGYGAAETGCAARHGAPPEARETTAEAGSGQ